MARLEAELVFGAEHRPLLETYASSMGWIVEPCGLSFAIYRREGTKEEYLLEDLNSAVNFLKGEGAEPLSFRIIRVIYDSGTGYNEIEDDNHPEP